MIPIPGDDDVAVTQAQRAVTDGTMLFEREWRPATGSRRGVYLLHGLGEHSGRYDALARWFCARGWQVRAHDHAGHGQSTGRRGVTAREAQLAEHAAERVGAFAEELGQAPLLLGHSLGGALAAELVVCRAVPVAGLVLSSPALDAGLNPAQKLLTAVLGALAPGLAIGNGLDPQALSHDAEVVRAYLDDPLVHDRVSAGLVRWLLAAGRRARAEASGLRARTLLLVAGSDRLVDARGSREFAERAPDALLTLRWYPALFHELFNELPEHRAQVLSDLDAWLDVTPRG